MSKNIEDEQVKPLILTDNETGTKYTLEFSRESVRFAEARGFDIDDVARLPMLKISELFYYAFRMHHRNVSKERTDKILFDDLKGLTDAALQRLVALYSIPYESLICKAEIDDEGEEKNARMTVEL